MSEKSTAAPSKLSEEAQRGLSKYLWKVVVPRECIIVVLFNAPIAWFVFRGREDITHLGWGGLMSYLGPMSFILSFFTSFFGWMVGILLKPYFGELPQRLTLKNWILPGAAAGILSGLLGILILTTILWGLQYLMPSRVWNTFQSVLIVCAAACFLASVFHPFCVRLSLKKVYS